MVRLGVFFNIYGRGRRRAAALLFAVGATLLGAAAQADVRPSMFRPFSPNDAALLKQAYDAAERGRWDAAYRAVRRVPDGAGKSMVDWLRMTTERAASFDETTRWMRAHRDWPSSLTIQRIAENNIPEDGPPAPALSFFRYRTPITSRGARIYAEALIEAGREAEGRALLRRAWTTYDVPRSERGRYLARHRSILSGVHETRLDRLLWDGDRDQAVEMLGRVSQGSRRLAEARIALQLRRPGVDRRINAVPRSLRTDPGLAYDRMRWRLRRNRRTDAEDMMIAQRDVLGRPIKWADERQLFAREALEEGHPARAYALAGPHGLTNGADFAELEWFAGWVALTRLNNPRDAYNRFRNLWDNVETPISRARAAYWAGEAAAVLGDRRGTREWRTRAAAYPITFYGQLAAQRLGGPPTMTLRRAAEAANASRGRFDLRLARVGMAFLAVGADRKAQQFFARAARTTRNAVFLNTMARELQRLRRHDMSIAVGKEAARNGLILPEALYPTPNVPQHACGSYPPPETALVLAVTRQESLFRLTAQSRAGARGLMQVMPGTARKVAEQLGLRYSESRLSNDAHYNTRLGACYMAELLERFDNSYVLAVAAYNAGPTRVSQWIRRFGDPRRADVDDINWAEMIPYSETRNYAQRVIENLHVYRARLNMRVGQARLRRR